MLVVSHKTEWTRRPGDKMSSQFLPVSLTSGDELKDDSIKKDRPCKIFFKDLFLFKENEMAAKKKLHRRRN
ncbi:Coiled-coil domain-containing protein 38 [Manis javanica]|nr:Coiled-coil domain-containing protein 38 [Manis javanica]